MKTRTKTLQAMVDKANQYLAIEDDSDKAKHGRETLATFVSSMLMEADSYKGFNYIYWTSIGCAEWYEAGEPEGKEKDRFIYGPTMDQTKIHYY